MMGCGKTRVDGLGVVTDCEHPIVMEYKGRPFCYMRYLRFVKTEYEKYLKRMKGDWS